MQWWLVKEYIAGFLTIYIIPAENQASAEYKLQESDYFNSEADYEFEIFEWQGHVGKVVEIDVW